MIIISDPDMNSLDGLVYATIHWFDRLKDGQCYASNETIASICGGTKGSVANSLTRLREAGYIHCEYDEKGNRKLIKPLIYNTVNPSSTDEGGFIHRLRGVHPQMNRIRISNKNTDISYGPKEEEQMLALHKGYIKFFKINTDQFNYADQETQDKLIESALKRYKLTPERKAKLHTRLQDAGFATIKQAIINANKSDWNHGTNPSGWTMDLYKYLLRSYEQVEDWANRK